MNYKMKPHFPHHLLFLKFEGSFNPFEGFQVNMILRQYYIRSPLCEFQVEPLVMLPHIGSLEISGFMWCWLNITKLQKTKRLVLTVHYSFTLCCIIIIYNCLAVYFVPVVKMNWYFLRYLFYFPYFKIGKYLKFNHRIIKYKTVS